LANAIKHEHWTNAGPIVATVDEEKLVEMEARAAATVGDAAPLGLLGFATATFTASAIFAGWYPAATIMYAIPILLVFGGIAQFIAAMWSYRKGDTFAATAFGSFGAFNTTYAVYLILQHNHFLSLTGPGAPIAGIWVGAFAFIAFFLSVAALTRNLALVGVLFFLGLTYGFLAVAAFVGMKSGWLTLWGGYAGIISSGLAFFTAMGTVINSNFRRGVVPLWSRTV
jgi:succinate-acetate transporter protein